MPRSITHAIGLRTSLLHLFTLVGFAVAQPLYDLLGRNPDFFTARHADAGEILFFILAASLLIPLLLFGVVAAAAALGRPARHAAHGLAIALLAALIVLPVLDRLQLPAAPALGIAVMLGALGAAAYFRYAAARQFVTVLSPAIVVFPLLFLLASPVGTLVLPAQSGPQSDMAVRDADRTPPTIVMVLLDELPVTSLLGPDGTVNRALFPNFAALADEAYLFRDTTTVSDNTLTAIPSILTGNYPETGLTAGAVDHPQNLFTLLADRYTLNVFEAVTELCPERLCPDDEAGPRWLARYRALLADLGAVYLHLVAPEAYRDQLPAIANQWKDFRWREARALDNNALHQRAVKEVRTDRAQTFTRFVRSIQAGSGPALHFLHILLPHAPYIHLPSGRVYSLPTRLAGLKDGRWQDDGPALHEAYQRHLLQLGFVDTEIGRLIERMKKAGIYDSALLVVAADHGVSFRPGAPQRRLSPGNYEDIAAVPLFIKRPGQAAGAVSDRRAQTIDILPTILDTAGIRPRGPVDGRSLFSAEGPPPERRVYHEHAERVMVVDEDELRARKAAALRRKRALLGTAEHALYEFGDVSVPARRVDELERRPPGTIAVELDHAFLFEDVNPAGAFIPSQVSGTLHGTGALRAGDRIGVAVNGVLWALTEPQAATGDTARFSVMVPEEAFRAGANEVRVFVARSGNDGDLALVPAGGTAAPDDSGRFRLSDAVIMAPDGRELAVEGGALEGWVDSVHRRGGLIQFDGWAADVDAGKPARRVVMFKNGEFVRAADAAVERIDVLQFYDDKRLRNSGFSMTLPARMFEDDSDVVRVFAISGDGRASELHYVDDFKWKQEP